MKTFYILVYCIFGGWKDDGSLYSMEPVLNSYESEDIFNIALKQKMLPPKCSDNLRKYCTESHVFKIIANSKNKTTKISEVQDYELPSITIRP